MHRILLSNSPTCQSFDKPGSSLRRRRRTHDKAKEELAQCLDMKGFTASRHGKGRLVSSIGQTSIDALYNKDSWGKS